MKVDQALYAHLTADAGVVALIPNAQIYPGKIPASVLGEDGVLPAMAYDLVENGDAMTQSGNSGLFASSFHITALDEQYSVVRAILAAVKAALEKPGKCWGSLQVYRVKVTPAISIDYNDVVGLEFATLSVDVQHAKET
jgi:hypothetical protein